MSPLESRLVELLFFFLIKKLFSSPFSACGFMLNAATATVTTTTTMTADDSVLKRINAEWCFSIALVLIPTTGF